jgi:1,4-dihydroxy-2-naphthoate polyprenyltransferase
MKMQVPLASQAARDILENFELKVSGNSQRARAVAADGENLFYQLEEGAPPIASFKDWFKALRAISLTVVIFPTLCTYFFLQQQRVAADGFAAVAGVLIPALLLLAVNMLNDVYDHLKLIDLPGSKGGSGVIQSGHIRPAQMKRLAYILIGVAAALALPILWTRMELLYLSLPLTLAVVLGYSGPILQLKYRAMGDLAVWLCCGPLLAYSYAYAVFGQIWWDVLFIGSFFGFMACSILHANNANDILTDAKAGARTVAMLLGLNGSKLLYILFFLLAYLSLVPVALNGALNPLFLLPLVFSFIPVVVAIRKLVLATRPDDPIIDNIREITPQCHLVAGILLLGGIIFLG